MGYLMGALTEHGGTAGGTVAPIKYHKSPKMVLDMADIGHHKKSLHPILTTVANGKAN